MNRTITFQHALIEGYTSKIRNGIAEKRVRFRALFTDKLALELDVETLSRDYWDGDLVLTIGQAGLILRTSAMNATLELDVQAMGKFTVKRSDDGPLVVRFEAVMTGSAVTLAQYHDSYGEAPGELKITVAEEQTIIEEAVKDGEQPGTVTLEVPGEKPLTMTDKELKDAGAKLDEADKELERARKIRGEAAADGNPFDGGQDPMAA